MTCLRWLGETAVAVAETAAVAVGSAADVLRGEAWAVPGAHLAVGLTVMELGLVLSQRRGGAASEVALQRRQLQLCSGLTAAEQGSRAQQQ